MPGETFDEFLDAALGFRRFRHLHRSRQLVRPIDSTHVEIDGVQYVNFCSNDYLGLSRHPQIVEAVSHTAAMLGVGAGASPLICGYTELHQQAEHALAQWKGTESALLLPSGYQANHAAVQTIAGVAQASGKTVRFLLDKLAHASLIDAARSTGFPFRVFGHNDLDKLARLLREADPGERQVVLTESIFSMDGDAASLAELVTLKRMHPFTLVLDEAHASGVYGADGSGYAGELGLSREIDVFVVTLSKAMGLIGGAVCASRAFCDAVTNFGRAYVYSTSVTAPVASACKNAIEILQNEPHRRQRVRLLAERVRRSLEVWPEGDSPIIPIMLGNEARASEAAQQLRSAGMLVLPIRPPTVPRGTSRLRITLSCDHTDAEIQRLIDAVRQIDGRSITPGAELDR